MTLVLSALPDLQVLRVQPDRKVNKELLDLLVLQEIQVLQALQGLQALLALTPQYQVQLVLRALQDLLEQPEQLDLPVQQDKA